MPNIQSPFFSIVIPTYNRPDLLVRAIESVINQSFKNFEIIIVNDGSSVGLSEYENIKKQFLNFENIVFIDKKNEGPSLTRNLGIQNSKGEYVCFLDDDDYYLENHLAELYELIQTHNSALGIYRTFSYFKENAQELISQKYTKQGDEHAVMYVLQYLILMMNVCINKTILKQYLFNPVLKVGEDYEMWVRILTKYPIFENEALTTVYDRTRESASTGSIPVFLNYIASFETIFNLPETNSIIPKEFKINKYKKYYTWILAIYLETNDIESYKKLKKAIVNHVGVSFYIFHYLRFLRKKYL